MVELLVEIVQGICVALLLVGAAMTFSAGVTLMLGAVVVFALLEVRS